MVFGPACPHLNKVKGHMLPSSGEVSTYTILKSYDNVIKILIVTDHPMVYKNKWIEYKENHLCPTDFSDISFCTSMILISLAKFTFDSKRVCKKFLMHTQLKMK